MSLRQRLKEVLGCSSLTHTMRTILRFKWIQSIISIIVVAIFLKLIFSIENNSNDGSSNHPITYKYRGGVAYANLLTLYLNNSDATTLLITSPSVSNCNLLKIESKNIKKHCALLYFSSTRKEDENIVLSALVNLTKKPCEVLEEVTKSNALIQQSIRDRFKNDSKYFCNKDYLPIAIGLFYENKVGEKTLIKTFFIGENNDLYD